MMNTALSEICRDTICNKLHSLPKPHAMKSGGRKLHEFWMTIQDRVDSSIPGFGFFTLCKEKPFINLTKSAVSPPAELKKIPNSAGNQNNPFQSTHPIIKVRQCT